MFRRALPRLAPLSGAQLAEMIKTLRYRTDAPMLQCKKAVVECDGDIEKAVAWLRAKGVADSDKKGGRETAYGTLAVCAPTRSPASLDVCPGVLLEMAAETDFAVRNDKFVALTQTIADDISAMLADDSATGAASEVEMLEAVIKRNSDKVKSTIAALGENVLIKRVLKIPTPPHGLMPRFAQSATAPAGVKLGLYVHNSTAAAPRVGSIVGVSSVWWYDAAHELSVSDADDFAQHLVSHMGDTGDVAQQSFLGSSQTVAQWSKERLCRLRVGVLHKYGLETPVLVTPRPIEAPKA